MRAALRREPFWGVALLIGAAAFVYLQARSTGVQGPSALTGIAKDVGKTGLACLALTVPCGYGPARLLLPAAARPHLLLYVLPIGAATSTLALTVLGVAHVPLRVSLPVVLAAGAALSLFAVLRGRRRGEPSPHRGTPWLLGLIVPLGIAFTVGVLAMLPALRAGFATVQGQNGDAILAVGTADFLSHAPPTAVEPDLALDRVPIQWRSKLPIYYGLAGVARIAGQDEVAAFSTVGAFVLGMFALGVFLFALHALRAPPLVALLAAFLVPATRIVVYVSIHTYYNQLWALFALPWALLFGWWFLRDPGGRSAVLAGLLLALALFTYPLLLPFPAVFLGVIAWRERARARGWVRSLALPRWAWAGAVLVAIPVVAVLFRGVFEKVVPAISALVPGGDLSGWAGGDVLPYLPVGRFVGIEAGPLALQIALVVAVVAAAALGLARSPRDAAAGLAVLLAGAVVTGLYLRLRGQGELFWFKDLAFAGPLVVLLAVVGLASLLRARPALRAAGALALAALAVGVYAGARTEVHATYELGSLDVLEIRDWGRAIPADRTIRIDVGPSSWQLWSWYLLPTHRVSVLSPLAGFFPHPPVSFAADYALEQKPAVPPDAAGPPVFQNGAYAIYRLDTVAGPDLSSKALIFDVKKITY